MSLYSGDESMNNVGKFLKELQLVDIGLTKIRVGPDHDGGYVVLKEICEQSDALYSYGIGDDVEFELDLLNRFLNIQKAFLFDPTIDGLPKQNGRFVFVKEGIENSLKFFKFHKSPMLKIDVEYNEWEALNKIAPLELYSASQIVIEFHLVHCEPREGLTKYFNSFYSGVFEKFNEELFSAYLDILRKLKDSFHLVHIHPNNSLGMREMNGYLVPPLLECTFVHKNLVDNFVPAEYQGSVQGLDYPNKNDRPDVGFIC